jgi:hypothetical protein
MLWIRNWGVRRRRDDYTGLFQRGIALTFWLTAGYQKSFAIICATVTYQYGGWTPYNALWTDGTFRRDTDDRAQIMLLQRLVLQAHIQLVMPRDLYNTVTQMS